MHTTVQNKKRRAGVSFHPQNDMQDFPAHYVEEIHTTREHLPCAKPAGLNNVTGAFVSPPSAAQPRTKTKLSTTTKTRPLISCPYLLLSCEGKASATDSLQQASWDDVFIGRTYTHR